MSEPNSETAHGMRNLCLLWVGAALAYFFAASLTIHLTSDGRNIAAVWPANAVLVALLLSNQPRWITVLSAGFIGNVAANLISRGTFTGPLLYGIANLVEVWIAVTLLREHSQQDSIAASPQKAFRFIVVAGVIAPLASGLIGGLTAFLVYGEPLERSVFTWVASDGLGLLVFTPFLSALIRGDFVTCFKRKTWGERAESFGLLVLIGAVTFYVFFSSPRPLLFAIFPPLMLITFRVGRLGTKAGTILVAIIGGVATMRGHSPMSLITPDHATQAQFFQAFLAALLLTCLPAAAEVTARDRRTDALAKHDRLMTMAAFRDPLTGTLNRAGLDAEAQIFFKDQSSCISVIAIDFDYFKNINDQWGHEAGDLALKHVACLLGSFTRDRDLIARLGGDEFIVLLPNSAEEAALRIAERIHSGVQVTSLTLDQASTVTISLSLGVASRRTGESFSELMRRADKALYKAKASGRRAVQKA